MNQLVLLQFFDVVLHAFCYMYNYLFCSRVDGSEKPAGVMFGSVEKDDPKFQSTKCPSSSRIIAQTSTTLPMIIIVLFVYL